MQRKMLKAKIRGGRITATALHYEGSIAIDGSLLEAADILPGEQVHVLNINNGSRLTTYAIVAPSGSGEIALKGAAARSAQPGDEVIILTYCSVDDQKARKFVPCVVHVDRDNRACGLTKPFSTRTEIP